MEFFDYTLKQYLSSIAGSYVRYISSSMSNPSLISIVIVPIGTNI